MILNIHAPINSLGYGIHSSNWLAAMYNRGLRFGLKPIGRVAGIDQDFQKMMFLSRFVTYNAPVITLWHANDIGKHRGSPNIGYTVFETTRFTSWELLELASLDAIWVVSEWAKGIVREHKELDHVDVYVVPEGVDPEIFRPPKLDYQPTELMQLINSIAQTGPERFVAITVGKYEKRKGIDLILNTIKKQSGLVPICLIALIDDPFTPNFSTAGISNLMSKYGFFPSEDSPVPEIQIYDHIDTGTGHRVIFIPRILATEQLIELYQYADLGVFPALAEGWNLPLIECLACGTRVLTVNYSGQTEYLNKIYDKDKTPLDIFMIEDYVMEKAKDERWFRGDRGEWAIPSSEQFKELFLKAIHEGRGIKNTCWEQLHEEFSWNNAVDKTIAVLQEMGIDVEYRETKDESRERKDSSGPKLKSSNSKGDKGTKKEKPKTKSASGKTKSTKKSGGTNKKKTSRSNKKAG